MIGYYRRKILKLSSHLQKLRNEPEDLLCLMSLQRKILGQIIHTENKINQYRAHSLSLKGRLKRERPPKEEATKFRLSITVLHRKIKQSQWLLFVWRSFGDGIAFSYVDKWSIKAFFFNTASPEPKPMAGFIGGKEGLAQEKKLLREMTNRLQLPCLLTDLTNTIRHGDICVLLTEPRVIEVKSSKNLSARKDRQISSIQKIHSFLDADEASDFRGFSHVLRAALSLGEKNYLDVLDNAVCTALSEGLAVHDLEPGTRLVVMGGRKQDYSSIFAGMNQPSITILSSAKNAAAWGCYYPFSLSLSSPECLFAFLNGDVFILVAFDMARIQQRAAELGMSMLIMDGDASHGIRFQQKVAVPQGPEYILISWHFLHRIAFELLSWEWVLNETKAKLQNVC